jgi:hypothetical protein
LLLVGVEVEVLALLLLFSVEVGAVQEDLGLEPV